MMGDTIHEIFIELLRIFMYMLWFLVPVITLVAMDFYPKRKIWWVIWAWLLISFVLII